ncbi:AbrB/MazE/SpoVT family DNA-binding domain-containing protein [Aphanothece hegewaldii]|nr:AbrB/MazE/SpoVT family DNA-binding domain-containing protein [Aphanothece hegewaldii]
MTKITEGGRILIPVEYRRALNLEVGDEVVCILDEGEIRIIPRPEAFRRAQNIIGRYVKSRSLADELISQRREEAHNE